MSAAWYAAFGLLAVLSVANAVVLVATLRQVGVLHQRLRPTGPGTHEGPQVGQELPLIPLEPVTDDAERRVFATPISVLVYVTPGCSICKALPEMVGAYLRQADDDVRVAFVTDVPIEAARRYADESALPAPLLHSDVVARVYALPGSPYVVALAPPANGNAMVLRAGVVNTLEQFEDLVEGAAVQLAAVQTATGIPREPSLTIVGSGDGRAGAAVDGEGDGA
jgi:hypothetical protein